MHDVACEFACAVRVRSSNGRERPKNSVLNKRHYLEAFGNKCEDLYEFIPQSFKMMSFV